MQKLNSVDDVGALNTIGLDGGYFITAAPETSIDDCWQHHDPEDIDASGWPVCLADEIISGVVAGVAMTAAHADWPAPPRCSG